MRKGLLRLSSEDIAALVDGRNFEEIALFYIIGQCHGEREQITVDLLAGGVEEREEHGMRFSIHTGVELQTVGKSDILRIAAAIENRHQSFIIGNMEAQQFGRG